MNLTAAFLCSREATLRSAWTEKGLGATMSSSSGCGAASNMRRCICGYESVRGPRFDRLLPEFLQRPAPTLESFDGTTPDKAYFTPLPLRLAA